MIHKIKQTIIFNKIRGIIRRIQSVNYLKKEVLNLNIKSKYKILIINHFFTGEIKAIKKVKKLYNDIEFLVINPEPHFSEIIHLFPQNIKCAKIPYDSLENKYYRDKSYKISKRIFKDIIKNFNFNCILTPSDSFYWLREFVKICKENKILTIVSDKEGTISPYSFETEPYRIKKLFPPISDYYMVWSKRQKKFWINAGVSENKIIITGSPRSDIFIGKQKKKPNNIIFFDFDLDAYINIIDINKIKYSGEKNWKYLRESLRNCARIIAQKYPDLKIIIKCHPQQTSYDFNNLNFKNLIIVYGPEISELLSESYAVVGFQTTALMEAALAKIPTFYMAWGELYEILSPYLLPFHEEGFGMTRCFSENEVVENLENVLKNNFNTQKTTYDKLSIFFDYTDGNCAKRLIESIISLINKKNSQYE